MNGIKILSNGNRNPSLVGDSGLDVPGARIRRPIMLQQLRFVVAMPDSGALEISKLRDTVCRNGDMFKHTLAC